MFVSSINWDAVNRDIAAVTPVGKSSVYFFGKELAKEVPNDAFIKFVGLDGTNLIMDIKIIPVYL